jgi:transposase-like protein
MRYSERFKARMVQRLTAPGAPSAERLSEEINVPGWTLRRWVRAAAIVADVGKKRPPERPAEGAAVSPGVVGPDREDRGTREWSPAEKLRVVAAAAQVPDAELGALLRREGIHLAQLEDWREDILTALGSPPPRTKSPDAKRVRELEREVARKDKALAEVTALLVLEKKVQALFGNSAEEGDSIDEKSDKK